MLTSTKILNEESQICSKSYQELSIRDQQRKILVITKICEIITEQSTSYSLKIDFEENNEPNILVENIEKNTTNKNIL